MLEVPPAIGGILARQAVSGPGHGSQAFLGDLAFASEADRISAFCDPLERCSDALQPTEIGLDPADGQITFGCPLNAIQRIRIVFDGDVITLQEGIFGPVQDGVEDLFEMSEFGALHLISASLTPPKDACKPPRGATILWLFLSAWFRPT